MTNQTKIHLFKTRLAALFAEITVWANEAGLLVEEQICELNEAGEDGTFAQPFTYQAPCLRLKRMQGHASQEIALFTPVSSDIIAGEGRIDLQGLIDQITLIYLDKGGPSFTSTIRIEDQIIEQREKPFYRGITEAGWYWIESSRRGRGYKMNRELFFDLLNEVSDYDEEQSA